MGEIQSLVEFYTQRFNREGAISAFQIGSSLRKEDFFENSDLDFLVIYDKKVKKDFLYENREIEINIIRRNKEKFLEFLNKGNPVDLVALNFGKILFGHEFVSKLRRKKFKGTEKTIESWIKTASFNFSAAANNYPFPTCTCCYFKDLHHSSRDFSRAIILKEKEKLTESNAMIIKELGSIYPELAKEYKFILKGRKNYQKFEPIYEERKKIEYDELGKYLLSVEVFARKAYNVLLNLEIPKINDLISEIEKDYQIKRYSGSWLHPEKREIALALVLEKENLKYFVYDLDKKTWKDLK